jgi:hypothetical protein
MMASFIGSPQFYVRLAGVFYLAIIVLGLLGESYVRGNLVVAGDAAATAQNIAGSSALWRIGIFSDLMMQVLDIPIIVVMYLMFKQVGAGLNLAATCFNLIQTAVLVVNKLTLFIPLLLLGGAAYLSAFSSEQLAAWSYLAVRMYNYGFAVGLIFFGIACVIRGYLIVKSELFPKFIGLLLALAGVCYLINSTAILLALDFTPLLFPWIYLPVLVGELTLSLWMMVKGMNLAKWRALQPHTDNQTVSCPN